MGRCAGDDGDLTFDSDSVRITRDEERAYADLFKHSRTGKNGYRTMWYRDRMRRLMQINGFDADLSAASANLHDDLAGGVHRESFAQRSYSLGANLLDCNPTAHWATSKRVVWLFVPVLD